MGDKQENPNHLVCSHFIETKNFPEIEIVCYLAHSPREYCLHCHTLFSLVLEFHIIRISIHFLCVSGFLMSERFIMLLISIFHVLLQRSIYLYAGTTVCPFFCRWVFGTLNQAEGNIF